MIVNSGQAAWGSRTGASVIRLIRARTLLTTLCAAIGLILVLAPTALASDNLADVVASPAGTDITYDTSSYQPGVESSESYLCPVGDTGGATGWSRFNAPVTGTLTVTSATSYDSILHLYTAPGDSAPTFDALTSVSCVDNDTATASNQEASSVHMTQGQSAYVQTLGICSSPCAPPGFPGVAAGPTTVRLAFVADDADGDGVPDSLDACPTTAGTGPDGCPVVIPPPPGPQPQPQPQPQPKPDPLSLIDSDKDGIVDSKDLCDYEPGDMPNGCPSLLHADVHGHWKVNRLLTMMTSLVVNAPVGSRIEVTCSSRGNACRFSARVIQRTVTRVTSLTKLFGKTRIFPAGASIVVRVTRPRQLGRYEHLVMRAGLRIPRVAKSCIKDNGTLKGCSV